MQKKSAGRILGTCVLAAVLGGLAAVRVPAQQGGSFTGGSSAFLGATEPEHPAQLAQSPGEGDSQSSPSASRQEEAAKAGEDIDYGESLDEALQKEGVRYENRVRELNFERTKVENEFAKQEVLCRSTADGGAVEECRKVAHQDRRKKLADLEIKDIDEKTEHARRETMIRNHWALKADPSQGH
ncbi:MAG TPA: hypothetical protein VGX03_19315 [Candidatus Binatia bacterium]|nr:hypothetical protein [Candidatus Binatia bacterium]